MADADSRTAVPNGTAGHKGEADERWFDRLMAAIGLRNNEGLRENLAQMLATDEAEHTEMFSPEERRLLQNILALRDVRIIDVMVPRADIVAVAETVTLADLIKTFREAGHSRLPVFRETLDDPVGFVHAKDVMTAIAAEAMDEDGLNFGAIDFTRATKALEITRPILFVPPSMPAMDLMVRMQANRTQLALVVDEYGGTDGLVSLEDLIETVVGDIEDEYDADTTPTAVKADDGSWLCDARVAVEDFEEEAGVVLQRGELFDDVDTLGGLVFALLGRIPVRGELVRAPDLPNVEFEVLEADPRRIKRVRVTIRPDDTDPPEECARPD